MAKTWREHAAPIIARVIDENFGKPLKEIKAALSAEYKLHYGERRMWPYKVWCSEVRRQLAAAFPPPVKEVNESELPLFSGPQ